MNEARKIILFVTGIAGGFVYICNVIPQIKTEPAPVEAPVGQSPEAWVTAGKRLFLSDRAQCLTCHSLGEDPKARCPDLERVGARAASRRPGYSAAEYLVESLYNPNAFIVPGYPKNQMTPVNKPPIALSHDQILTVIAFLNSLGGTSDTSFIQGLRRAQDPWRKGLLKPRATRARFRIPVFPGDPGLGRQAFLTLGCANCHRIGEEGQNVGPDLTAIGASQSSDYLLESVLDPNAVIVKGYKQMTVIWKDAGELALQGTVRKWIPEETRPRAVVINAPDEDGFRDDREIELSQVAGIGDTVVEVRSDTGRERYCGNYVEGDEHRGIKLLQLRDGRWKQQTIPPGTIESVHLPQSPMPANFQDLLTPRQVYDLVAYLSQQKGKP